MAKTSLFTALILLWLGGVSALVAQPVTNDVANTTAQLDPPPAWMTEADRRLIRELSAAGYSAVEQSGNFFSHGGTTQIFEDWQRACDNLSKGLDWSGRKLTRDEWRGLFRGANKAQQWLDLKNRMAQQADKLGKFVKALNIVDAGFKALGHAWEGDTSGMLIVIADEAGECVAVAAGAGTGAVAGPAGSVIGAGLAQEAWNATGHTEFERMAQHVKNLERWQANAGARTQRLIGNFPEFEAFMAGKISEADFKQAVHKVRDEYQRKRERIRRALTVQAHYDPSLTPLIAAWWKREKLDPAAVQQLRDALNRAGFRPLDPVTCKPLPPPDQALVQSSQNATLVRAVPREEPRQLFTAAGGFKEQPVDHACENGPVIAPLLLEAGGKLRLKLEGNPPVPCTWSIYNAGVSMALNFAPRLGDGYGRGDALGSLALSCEREGDGDLRGSAEIDLPGPGRLSLGIGAPRGSGPLTGSCFGQGYSASVELIDVKTDVPSPAGQVLQAGDRLRTGGGGHVLFNNGSGTQALLGANSDIGYTPTGFDLASGSVRVRGAAHLPVTVDGRTVQPDGTEFTVTRTADGGQVTVWEGTVTVTQSAGPAQRITAGQTYGWPGDTLSATAPESDQREWLDGLPLRAWAALDTSPEPAGVYPLRLAENGTPANGWLWQDPQNDAQLTAVGPNGVQISTPDGNEFWGGRIDAPRLLHKVTGDFTLEGELQLTGGNHLASVEPLLYAPGSYQGQYADQMQADRMATHWRILGGGWIRYQNANKLATLEQRDFLANPDAPTTPIHIRLSRRGAWWRVLWSVDATHWNLAFRERLSVPETVWVGWLCKRLQYDGVTEPALTTLKDMKLTIAPHGGLGEPAWEFEQVAGSVVVDGSNLTLSHDGGKHGGKGSSSIVAYRGGAPLTGDFDVVARYRVVDGFAPGQQQHLYLFARQDVRNLAYSGYAREGNTLRYQTDMQINSGWYRYQQVATTDTSGWLRVRRQAGQMMTFQWYEGAWRQLDQFRDTLTSPVFLGVALDNGSEGSAATVEFAIEHLDPDSAGPDWLPPAEILQPIAPPAGLVLPAGVTVRAYQAPFVLSGLLLDQGGTALLFGGEQRQQPLISLDAQGHSRPVLISELLAGRNRKSGLELDDRLLIGVDGWYEGGNRYAGVYELALDGAITPLQEGYGGLGDVIADGAGGWYLVDFEKDNIFRHPASGPDIPVLTGKIPYGLVALARDPETDTLYVLNWSGGGAWPFGGDPAIYTVQDGTVNVRSTAPDATDFADIAYNPGGVLPRGLYASHPATNQLLAIGADGRQTPVLVGMPRPQWLDFAPVSGDLVLIYDDRSVLWLGRRAEAVAQSRYEQAKTLREAGAALQAAGRLSEALEKYRASLELYPDSRLDAHIRLIEKHTGHRRP